MKTLNLLLSVEVPDKYKIPGCIDEILDDMENQDKDVWMTKLVLL